MEMEQNGPRRLRISLTGEELGDMHLTYDRIDLGNAETRDALLSLLEAACLTTGFSPGERVLIEVFPAEEGGCEILLSDQDGKPPRRWKVRRRVEPPVVYAFDDVDTLIDGAVRLFHRCSHRIHRSALYRANDGWRLAVYPLDVAESTSLPLLDEYARRCGEGPLAAAWLSEHAQPVLEDNAVDLISAYFG